MNLPDVPPWRVIYDRLAPGLALLCLVIAVVAAAGTYVNDRNDRERDRAIARANAARIAENARLLECFDDFATTLAGGLPPVREATIKRDEALSNALRDLENLLVKALADNADPRDGDKLVKSLQQYREATQELRQVREDNPYPEPPSTFCATRE